MSFTAIISGIFSTVKSIRVIAELIDKSYELWVDAKIEGLTHEHNNLMVKRRTILKSISEAKDDNARKTLSIILSDLS
jgi:uncharacterized protein YoxC